MSAAGHKEHEAPVRQRRVILFSLGPAEQRRPNQVLSPTAFRLLSAVHDVVIRVYDERDGNT